jgi:putative FmdB family regulatory protein
MPFYEYECASCKFYTEVMQKISDPPLEKCPSCGKKALKKLVSAPVFRLKGGGWYETDFKSDKEGKRNIADREEPAGKSEDTKTGDSKPAPSVSGEPAGKTASGSGGGSSEGAAKVSAAESSASNSSSARGSRGKTSGARSMASRGKPAAKSASKSSSRGRARSPARKKGRR